MTVCNICDGSGLIPFVNKQGKVIPNAFLYCECREDESEHYRQVSPQDFDFPMSYSFYRLLCQEHGWPDPGSDRLPMPVEAMPQVVEHIHRHSDMSAKEFDLLQQITLEVKYLRDKLAELETRKGMAKGRYQRYKNA